MKRTKAGKLLCLGIAVMLAFSTAPQMLVRAEETEVQVEETEVRTEETEVQAEETEVRAEETEVQNTSTAVDGFAYRALADGTLEITRYSGSDTAITIPAEIDGKKVTSIGRNAFSNDSSLTSIVIPEGVTSIEEYAFSDCSSLTSIVIPEGVTKIEYGAFQDCTSLRSITIPESITCIEFLTFAGCRALRNVTIPESVKEIESDAFSGCNALVITCAQNSYAYTYAAENDIPCRLEGDYIVTFDTKGGEISGRNSKVIHGGEVIGELPAVTRNGYVFHGWFTQETGGEAVTENTKVTADMTIYAQWKAIEWYGLLMYIELDDDTLEITRYIGDDIAITIPAEIDGKKVTSIGNRAFENCSSMKSIVIPKEVTSIADDVFFGCDNFEIICVKGSYAHTYAENNNISYRFDHVYTSAITTKPTCTKTGVKTYTCSKCGDTYTESIAATGHTYTSKVTKAPTCTKAGVRTYTCSKCKDTYTETVAVTGKHTVVKDKAVKATCTKTGKTAGSHCSVCGTAIVKQKTVAKLKHSYKTTITKATVKKNGAVVKKCKKCGKKNKAGSYTLYRPKSIKLSKTSVAYTGKEIKPTVTVTDSKGKKINKKHYTVTYKNNVNPGKATVTVQFKGKYYKGKLTKNFTIHPKKTSISTITSMRNCVTVSWKRPGKVKNEYIKYTDGSSRYGAVYQDTGSVTGYQIQYAANKNFKNAKSIWVEGESENSKDIVMKDYTTTKYYFRVRAYKNVKVNGKKKKFYSAWSAKKETTIAEVVWKGPYPVYTIMFDENGYPYYYGKWGGSANMDADNYAKTCECDKIVSNYMSELYSHGRSYWLVWSSVGYHSDMHVVRRYVTGVQAKD